MRGKLPERRIPPLGVEKGLATGKIVLLLLFAGPLAGPLVFDIQTPRRPRPTRKITPPAGSVGLLLVKHQDLWWLVAGGWPAVMGSIMADDGCSAAMHAILVAYGCSAAMHAILVADGCSAPMHAVLVADGCSAAMHAIVVADGCSASMPACFGG